MKFGFSKVLLAIALSAIVCAWGDEESGLIAVLESDAGAAEKSAACVRLRIIGTAAAVPALSELLRDEKTAHAARHALETIPGKDAAAALQNALKQASGPLKAGLVDSLGNRADTDLMAVIAPLLSAPDEAVKVAAARALGRRGGPQAIEALLALSPNRVPAVQEALLECADRHSGQPIARKAYSELLRADFPPVIRSAAWRGLVMSAPEKQAETICSALAATDEWLREAALSLVYQSNEPALLEDCAKSWARMPADAQLAILNARVRTGGEVLGLALQASESPHAIVRTAAWRAMGGLEASIAVGALARAAAHGDTVEKEAAHEALCRMSGGKTPEAILKAIAVAKGGEKTELLRVLGERGERSAGPVLLRHAADADEEARLAALESLSRIGDPEMLAPVLALAANCPNEGACEAVIKTLEGICRAAPNKEEATSKVLDAMTRSEGAARRRLMGLLPELGTGPALARLKAAAADPNEELAREAVRTLARWPNASPVLELLTLARTHGSAAMQVLAVRGGIELAGHEPDSAKRVALLRKAFDSANRPAEKKQALAALGAIPALASLALAESALDDAAIADEAAQASIGIAEKLSAENPDAARKTAERLLAIGAPPEILSRAWKLRGKPFAGPFIQNWTVAGPFSKAGTTGAQASFDAVFGPESGGDGVPWSPVPAGNQVNLAALFPGRDNCAAYLKTRIVAPDQRRAVLLLGSDDGVKAWLNGAVVHGNNVDRGDVPDQDAALIELNQGSNDLMLKVSQGGGGWSVHARIVGLDGRPIAGLRDER